MINLILCLIPIYSPIFKILLLKKNECLYNILKILILTKHLHYRVLLLEKLKRLR